MSIKPTVEESRWAVTVGGVESPAQLSPDGSHKDDGYDDDETPTAKEFNYLLRRNFAWAKYLSDGALNGDHTINGLLSVGGQTVTFGPSTFTADNTTEIFTVTAHSLVTGDGPLRVSTTTTLPTGLTAGTNYWVIVLTVNTFKLATSFADAIAGTFLAIADNGTGTHTMVSFGATRPFSATVSRDLVIGGNATVGGTLGVAGAATVGGALNITDLASLKHGATSFNLPAKLGALNGNTVGDGVVNTSATPFYIAFPLSVGKHAVSFALTYLRSSGTLSVSIVKINGAGTVTGTAFFNDTTGVVWQTVNSVFAFTVAAGEFYELKIVGAGSQVSGCAISVSQL